MAIVTRMALRVALVANMLFTMSAPQAQQFVNERRYNQLFVQCLEKVGFKITDLATVQQYEPQPAGVVPNYGTTVSMPQFIDALYGSKFRICEVYARSSVEKEGAYVSMPDVATKSDIQNLQADNRQKMEELIKKFQENFVWALACSFATDAEARKEACGQLPK